MKIFCQQQHFEVIFIILSRVDHDYSRKSLKSSKAKNCQIRVLIEDDWSLTFGLVHDLMAKNMISWAQIQHLDLITWLKTFLEIQVVDSWKFESIDEKSTVTQKSNFDFFGQQWNSKIKNHHDIQNYQIWSSRIIKSQQK